MPARLFIAITLFVLVIVVPVAHGAIVGTSGVITSIATPADARLGALENDAFIRVFPERQGVVLGSSVSVDISQPGTVPIGSINLTPDVIPAGTQVNSYLLHFDVVGTPLQPITPSTSSSGVTFSDPVLGIEVLSTSLDATDGVLGAPGTLYPVGETLRGLELAVGQIGINTFDGINLSPDRKTVFVILSVQLSLDQVRIITAVPEPSSYVLLAGAGMFGALAVVRGSIRKCRTG